MDNQLHHLISLIATDNLQVKLLQKRGYHQEICNLTADNLKLLLEVLKKAVVEEKARELIKQEHPYVSDQQLIETNCTGFMHLYLLFSANFEEMKTNAKPNVIQTLAKYDLSWDHTNLKFLNLSQHISNCL